LKVMDYVVVLDLTDTHYPIWLKCDQAYIMREVQTILQQLKVKFELKSGQWSGTDHTWWNFIFTFYRKYSFDDLSPLDAHFKSPFAGTSCLVPWNGYMMVMFHGIPCHLEETGLMYSPEDLLAELQVDHITHNHCSFSLPCWLLPAGAALMYNKPTASMAWSFYGSDNSAMDIFTHCHLALFRSTVCVEPYWAKVI
jgi:hypothetical protein